MNYNELLQTTEWQDKRQQILERDYHQCRNCSSKEKLQVHHRQYHYLPNGEKVNPWAYENKYLITLCVTCHEIGHEQYKVPSFRLNDSNSHVSQTAGNKTSNEPLITQI